jgi:hypothetical protein
MDIPSNLDCDLAAKTISNWMTACEKHPQCNTHTFLSAPQVETQKKERDEDELLDAYLPKRLIWLDEDLRAAGLVPCPTSSSVSYAALSYCWGANGTFKTDRNTLPEFEKHIPLNNLPQTLKDAFNLTTKIGLDYLWVDAICIVQEGTQEWEQESRKMGRIYSKSKIVLSATHSLNVNEGIFEPRATTSISEDIITDSICARRNQNYGQTNGGKRISTPHSRCYRAGGVSRNACLRQGSCILPLWNSPASVRRRGNASVK